MRKFFVSRAALISSTTSTGHTTHQSNLLPFVGRDDLLHELSIISEEVKAGHGVTVLIQGEGGIGKTRLLNEFSSRLISNPIAVDCSTRRLFALR